MRFNGDPSDMGWFRVQKEDADDADFAEDAETATVTAGPGILGGQGRREKLLMKSMKGA